MTETVPPSTRERILDAAVHYVEEHPAEDMPLRAVCRGAEVQLPTLYHHFGSKKGLLAAVEQIGFERFMEHKGRALKHADFFDDVRSGWDNHIRFGMENPGLYILMYGQLEPRSIDTPAREPELYTATLCARAETQGLLTVSAERAAAHIMCNCIGATLRFIGYGYVDDSLSHDIREATLASIANTPPHEPGSSASTAARQLLRALSTEDTGLAEPELELLRHWLRRIE